MHMYSQTILPLVSCSVDNILFKVGSSLLQVNISDLADNDVNISKLIVK